MAEQFEFLRTLTQGDSGALYLAERRTDRRRVHLRVFPPDVGTGPATRPFDRACMTLMELAHPNVVPVLDFGATASGQRFLVSHAPPGTPLRHLLAAHGAVHPSRAVRVLMHVAMGLGLAKGRDVTHGNLKPDHVWVSRGRPGEEDANLVDVGVTRLLRLRNGDPTGRNGPVLGTPRYMSPEQIRGVVDDPATDIYALGVVAYEMLAGRVPFDGPDGEPLLQRHLKEPPAPLSALALPVPVSAALEQLVMGMLDKAQDKRPSHASVVERLEVLPEFQVPVTGAHLDGTGVEDGSLPLDLSLDQDASRAVAGPGGDPHPPRAMTRTYAPAAQAGEKRPPSSRRLAWLAGGGGVVLGAVVVVALALSGRPPPPGPLPAPVAEEQAAAPPSVDVDMEGLRLVVPKGGKSPPAAPRQAVPRAAAPGEPAPDKAEGLVRVTVESEPSGAQVWDGPVVRGTTPATVLLPRGTTPRVLTLKLEGYQDATARVVLDKDTSVTLKLTADPAAASRETPALPEEPALKPKAQPEPALQEPPAPVHAPAAAPAPEENREPQETAPPPRAQATPDNAPAAQEKPVRQDPPPAEPTPAPAEEPAGD
jgi:serine/threonine-protein kinase